MSGLFVKALVLLCVREAFRKHLKVYNRNVEQVVW